MTAPFLTLDARATNNRSRELKNQVFVFLAVIANTLGNFLLSVGMHPIQLKRRAVETSERPLGDDHISLVEETSGELAGHPRFSGGQ